MRAELVVVLRSLVSSGFAPAKKSESTSVDGKRGARERKTKRNVNM